MAQAKLNKIYYSTDGYMGKLAMKKHIKKKNMTTISSKDIDEFYATLYEQNVTQSHKPIAHFSAFDGYLPKELYQMDIMYMPDDNGFKYMLTLIDVGSRKAFAHAMKTKTVENVIKCLQEMIKLKEYPKVLQCDNGSEFNNRKLGQWCFSRDIELRIVPTNLKRYQSIIERFHKTLQTPIVKYQMHMQSQSGSNESYTKWVHVYKKFINAYNNRIHGTINASPNKVFSGNEEAKRTFKILDEKPPLTYGTAVRIQIDIRKFKSRAGDQKFSRDIWYVMDSTRKSEYEPWMYTLMTTDDSFKVNKDAIPTIEAPRKYYREELKVLN